MKKTGIIRDRIYYSNNNEEKKDFKIHLWIQKMDNCVQSRTSLSLVQWMRRPSTLMKILIALVVVMVVVIVFTTHRAHGTITAGNFFSMPSPWGWRCEGGTSVKYDAGSRTDLVTLNQCKLTCGKAGVLWPLPSSVALGNTVSLFLPHQASLSPPVCEPEVCRLLQEAFEVFRDALERYHPDYAEGMAPWIGPWDSATQGHRLVVNITVRGSDTHLTLDTDESYTLDVRTGKDSVPSTTTATIKANTFFGARHALETLSQLVEYHETKDALMVVDTAAVTDQPAFPYRGLLLDTSRNFMSVSVLQRTLDAMAASKLNTLHWHITDTHSFPLALDTLPNMAYYGAYSPRQVYTPGQVRHLVEYARVRGIRLLPELDAPAHVGSGWEWGEKNGLGRLAVCVNKEPWQQYCVEPPCGQLNLANPKMYEILGKIYNELFEMFEPVDLFHYGGDEVNLNCWNTTEEIVTWMNNNSYGLDENAYYRQWGVFQSKSQDLVRRAAKGRKVDGILWTSELTKPGRLELSANSSQYIIQIWSEWNNTVISDMLSRGHRVIFSNHDAWYLDCGVGAWVGEGNNWCSPYKGWQTVYSNSPHDIALNLTGLKHENLILGGEAALWSEQADSATADSKLWPRGAALGERLWSNPTTTWEDAETRFIHHRQRLVHRGVDAERIQPEWCHQNEGLCYLY